MLPVNADRCCTIEFMGMFMPECMDFIIVAVCDFFFATFYKEFE